MITTTMITERERVYNNREFTQRQEYDYDYVNGRIKLQTQHYFTGIPFIRVIVILSTLR